MGTKYDKKKQMGEAKKAASKAEELERAGGIPMTGLNPLGMPESTIGMSKSEKFFSEGRALDKVQREGYKTFGDKATGEQENKLRALQGLPAISHTPKEFTENINKSVGFGGKSALLDQEGRDRALKGGIGAGLSYEEADAEVTKAYDFLKKKYGGKDTPTTPTPTPTTTPTPTPTPTPSPSAPSSPTLPPEVPVEKNPIVQFFDDAMTSGTPERALIKGGSLILKGTAEARAARAAAEAAAEAAAKTAGAAGDAAKPFNMVDDAAKTADEALKQKYNFRPASAVDDAAKAAAKVAGAVGDAAKPFNMVDDAAKAAAKYAETSKAVNATLDAASAAAQKTGMRVYNAALRAGQSKEAALAAANAAENAAIQSAYKDVMDNYGKSFDAVDEAAGATDEAAGAADEAASVADEAASATDEAAGAADEAAAAAGKGKGAIARLVNKAAKSRLGRIALKGLNVGGKGFRVFGRAAGPVLEIYDAARYFTGDQEVKDQYAKDVATLGQRVFQPKSFGEFAGGVGDVLSPTKNVLGTAEAVRQLLKAQEGARTADASLKYAQSVIKAQNDRRKELYPDEVFDKLPKAQQVKIKQAIRQEFSDAGVKTFGRYQ